MIQSKSRFEPWLLLFRPDMSNALCQTFRHMSTKQLFKNVVLVFQTVFFVQQSVKKATRGDPFKVEQRSYALSSIESSAL